MGWIRCVLCKKLQRDFVARTLALIAPFQYVLEQVSCSYETIPNAPKYYEMLRNISFGSNGVDWVCSLRKITIWLHGTNFCINCTSSVCFATSFMQLRNDANAPKYYKMHWNISFGSNGVDQCVRCEKLQNDFIARTFALLPPVHPVLHRVSNSYETIPNAPKHYETHQNMRLRLNGVDQVRSLRKITTRLPGTNFCINWTSSVCFETSFLQLRNDPKCTQILRNAPKH